MTTIATLCSGGELFGVGARDAGLAHLWGIESELGPHFVAMLNGFNSILGTVQGVNYSSLEAPYWLHMSPPCTNASNANTQGGETELDIEIAEGCIRAIRTLRPPMVSLENVLGYRKFKSFKRICHALREEGYALEWWHLNSADYGVAQTRRRLFLVASRVSKPSKPAPTHQKRKKETGQLSLFAPLPAWVGWYEAIEDLLDTLPEDEFAPWQMQRLPDELRTMLVAQGGYDGKVVTVGQEQPAFTVTANQNQAGLRALLMPGGNASNDTLRNADEPCVALSGPKSTSTMRALLLSNGGQSLPREGDEPSQVVVAQSGGGLPRALLINQDSKMGIYRPDEPAMTGLSSPKSAYVRAFIVDGQANSHGESMTIRHDEAPCFVVSASQEKRTLRAYAGGRVVRMAPRCLARFQSIPDSYLLPDKPSLACTVIGNAVPPKMAEALVRANLP